jgi:hypothetical protein
MEQQQQMDPYDRSEIPPRRRLRFLVLVSTFGLITWGKSLLLSMILSIALFAAYSSGR